MERVVDRAECATGASCAMCAFGRAMCAASGSGAGGRVSRNEQVVGSIPTDGSLSCSSVTFIDLNFDGLSISVERVVWSGWPDARVSCLQSVIDGRVPVPLAHGDPTRSRQPAACHGWASRPRQLGSSVRSASCASPHAQSSATPFRGVERAAGLRVVFCARRPTLTAGTGRQLAWSDAHRRSAHACAAMVAAAGCSWARRPPRMASRSVATSSTRARKYGSICTG